MYRMKKNLLLLSLLALALTACREDDPEPRITALQITAHFAFASPPRRPMPTSVARSGPPGIRSWPSLRRTDSCAASVPVAPPSRPGWKARRSRPPTTSPLQHVPRRASLSVSPRSACSSAKSNPRPSSLPPPTPTTGGWSTPRQTRPWPPSAVRASSQRAAAVRPSSGPGQ